MNGDGQSRIIVPDWVKTALLLMNLIYVAYGYGRLNDQVDHLQNEVSELKYEISQLRVGH